MNDIHNYVLDKHDQYDQVLSSLYTSKEEENYDGFIELKIVMLTPGSEGLSS